MTVDGLPRGIHHPIALAAVVWAVMGCGSTSGGDLHASPSGGGPGVAANGDGTKPDTSSGAGTGATGGGSASGSGGSGGALMGTGGSGAASGGSGATSSGEICSLPIVAGPCEAAFPRFAFSTEKGQCVPFVYGGCGGNENNFESLEDCEAACGGTLSQCPERSPAGEACDESEADLVCTYNEEDCLCTILSSRCVKVDSTCRPPSRPPQPPPALVVPVPPIQSCSCSQGKWQCTTVRR